MKTIRISSNLVQFPPPLEYNDWNKMSVKYVVSFLKYISASVEFSDIQRLTYTHDFSNYIFKLYKLYADGTHFTLQNKYLSYQIILLLALES